MTSCWVIHARLSNVRFSTFWSITRVNIIRTSYSVWLRVTVCLCSWIYSMESLDVLLLKAFDLFVCSLTVNSHIFFYSGRHNIRFWQRWFCQTLFGNKYKGSTVLRNVPRKQISSCKISALQSCSNNGSTCQTKNHLERQEHQNKTQNKISDNIPVCMWDLDTHSRTTEENQIARV